MKENEFLCCSIQAVMLKQSHFSHYCAFRDLTLDLSKKRTRQDKSCVLFKNILQVLLKNYNSVFTQFLAPFLPTIIRKYHRS